MKRIVFAAVMSAVCSSVSVAQEAESISYDCIVKLSSGMSFDEKTLDWGPMKYNLRGYRYWLSLYKEGNDVYRVIARHFGEIGEYCLDMKNNGEYLKENREGILECNMDGESGAQTWRFNVRTLRFMAVYSDGYLDGGTGGVPRVELGQCMKR